MTATPLPGIPVWSVADSRRTLLRNGNQEFLLADTLWAAFPRMTEKEWDEALRLRRRQNFNAVNVSMLPIPHDRSISGEICQPFHTNDRGEWDMSALNEDYFVRARTMILHAQSVGITPIVVLLWLNYAPGTWGAQRTPETVMSEEQNAAYLTRAIEAMEGTGAIVCISGDEDLTSAAANARYVSAGRMVRAALPGTLVSLHTAPSAVMPAALAEDDTIDFYAYQSGHDTGWLDRAVEMSARYARLEPIRPVFSIEPCYEAHGMGGGARRHDARAVRAASWASVLGGATAGLGYGAHGAWSWHEAGADFNGEAFSGTPLPAYAAMQLPGAWDVGHLRMLVEQYNLFDLVNANELLLDDRSGAQLAVAASDEKLVAYNPHSFRLRIDADLGRHELRVWNLAQRRLDHVRYSVADGITTLEQPDANDDLLYIFTLQDSDRTAA